MKPNDFTSYVAKLAEIHGKNSELHMGQYKELYLQNRQWAYARVDHNSAVVTALNNDEQPAVFYVTLPKKAEHAIDQQTQQTITLEPETLIIIRHTSKDGRMIKVK